MKSIFVFIISSVVDLALALVDLHVPLDVSSCESRLRGRSTMPNYNKSRNLNASCGGALQRRGQCFGKSNKEQKPYPARNQATPIQSPVATSRTGVTSVPQKPDTHQFRPLSRAIQSEKALASGRSNQHRTRTTSTSGANTALAMTQRSKYPSSTNYIGPAQSSHQSVRHNLLDTGAISTIAPTELDSVSSGSLERLSSTERNVRRLRPPTAKVKLRGPGFIEVDNFQGEPRTTNLGPGERGRDAIRDPNGAQSIAYTNPGGKSRSRGKGSFVTAKVNKHGIGTATIRTTDPTRTTEEVVGHGTYGTKTFTASSDDPVNPATIKVKAAGSIYTSMMVQNKPVS